MNKIFGGAMMLAVLAFLAWAATLSNGRDGCGGFAGRCDQVAAVIESGESVVDETGRYSVTVGPLPDAPEGVVSFVRRLVDDFKKLPARVAEGSVQQNVLLIEPNRIAGPAYTTYLIRWYEKTNSDDGIQKVYGFTYDNVSGERVTILQALGEEHFERVVLMSEERLSEMFEGVAPSLARDPVLFENFYVTEDVLGLVFSEGVVAPSDAGAIEFELRLEDIAG